MSAYICSPAQFAALAAFALSDPANSSAIYEFRESNDIDSAKRIASELARQNIRSVAYRYPDSNDLPGPNMGSNKVVIQEAERLAEKYLFFPRSLKPLDYYRMCQGYEYQSSENPEWSSSLAYRQIDWLKDKAVRMLPGYENAVRDYEDDGDNASAPICLYALAGGRKKKR